MMTGVARSPGRVAVPSVFHALAVRLAHLKLLCMAALCSFSGENEKSDSYMG
jgi:hypothetical protein